MDAELVAELEGVLTRLVAADTRGQSDSESVVALHRCLSQLEAVTTRAVGVWDADRTWAADGAQNGVQWLAHRCRLPKQALHRRFRLAREVRHLPHAEESWLAGRIDGAHVSALAKARNERTADVMDRDEAELVGHAEVFSYRNWHRVLRYWEQHADPDGVEDTAGRLHDQRRVELHETFDGAWHGELLLDPVGGAVVANALKQLERELFEHDWREAKERLGREPGVPDLVRTGAQRRADALVEMAMRAMTAPKHGRRPRPLFTVLVGYETFAGRVCELANRTVVTPGQLAPWIDQADVERVVFDGPSRVVDVGAHRRLFSGATRRAAEVLTRECFHPLCDRPAVDCQIDHITPHARGGATSVANGRAACGHHNRLRNQQPEPP